MGIEIERKFLVKGDFKPFVINSRHIIQAYIVNLPERNVRIRISEKKGFITIKGKSSENGLSRFEWEKEINFDEAKSLLALCEGTIIEKNRFIVKEVGGLIYEIDVFEGDNKGLRIAEIELPNENTTFEKPDWLGNEVTGDIRYYNAYLVKNPYKNWKDRQYKRAKTGKEYSIGINDKIQPILDYYIKGKKRKEYIFYY